MEKPVKMLVDKKSAIYLSGQESSFSWEKQMHLDYKQVNNGELQLAYCSTEVELTDILRQLSLIDLWNLKELGFVTCECLNKGECWSKSKYSFSWLVCSNLYKLYVCMCKLLKICKIQLFFCMILLPLQSVSVWEEFWSPIRKWYKRKKEKR